MKNAIERKVIPWLIDCLMGKWECVSRAMRLDLGGKTFTLTIKQDGKGKVGE